MSVFIYLDFIALEPYDGITDTLMMECRTLTTLNYVIGVSHVLIFRAPLNVDFLLLSFAVLGVRLCDINKVEVEGSKTAEFCTKNNK